MTTIDDELELTVTIGTVAVVVVSEIELVMMELVSTVLRVLASDVGRVLLDSVLVVGTDDEVGWLMTSLEIPNWFEY